MKVKAWTAAVAFLALTAAESALAWSGLQGQSVNGFSRYCTYADGGVLTVGATELCPTTNQGVPGYGASPNISVENRNGGFGALTGQKTNGLSRYCFYSDKAVVTVGITDLCPVTDR